MKQWLTRLITIAVIVAIGFWFWQKLFPSPEKVVRQRVARVSKLASFAPNQGNLAAMSSVASLLECFTADVECFIETPDLPETGDLLVTGRADLRNMVLAARANFNSLQIDFIDVGVIIAPDGETATSDLTARVSLPHEKDFLVHEMKFSFRKAGRDWLVSRIETVKTLK